MRPYSARRMSKADKRQRQRENRASRKAREEREARRRRVIRFATRAGIVLAVVIGAGVVLSLLRGGDDEPADTTAAPTTSVATTATDGAPTTTVPAPTTTVPAATTAVDPEALSPEYQQYRELPVACGAEAPPPVQPMEFEAPDDQAFAAGQTVTATLSTSCGDMVIELDPGLAPATVNSFVFLARQDYFDGVVSHRIVPGFVVQFGDPTATGGGGPGYNVPDEFPAGEFAYDRGVVAMANVDGVPNSTGSQFFLPFGPTTLGPNFNPVGRIVEGLEVLDRIEAIPVSGQRPLEALYIEDIAIEAS